MKQFYDVLQSPAPKLAGKSLIRKSFLLSLIVLFPLLLLAQKKTEYKASNGITYHVGDTIKLGRGSSPMGNFMYVQMGGWAKAVTYDANKGPEQYNLSKDFAGLGAVIKKIRSEKAHGLDRYIFTVGLGSISNFDMYIEDAIGTCEIADCKKNPAVTATTTPASAADELAKYKKLLDQGAITKAEYDAVKKKLLNL